MIKKWFRNSRLSSELSKHYATTVVNQTQRREMSRPRAGTMENFLNSRTLVEFPMPEHGEVRGLQVTSTLADALDLLSSLGALAAPVFDDDQCIGVVDSISIVFFVLDAMAKDVPKAKEVQSNCSAWLRTHDSFKDVSLRALVGTPRFLPFVSVSSDQMLSDAMALLGPERFHRVLVTNPQTHKIENIITQSAVVAYLARHLDEFGSVAELTITGAGLAHSQTIFSVGVDDTVYHAFTIIKEKNVSGLPIIDEEGAVIGNISDRHIRPLLQRSQSMHIPLRDMFGMTLTAFLSSVGPNPDSKVEMHPAITCRHEDTVGHVLRKMAKSRIHRIFLVDVDHKPIRVIALGDIISLFVKAEEELERKRKPTAK